MYFSDFNFDKNLLNYSLVVSHPYRVVAVVTYQYNSLNAARPRDIFSAARDILSRSWHNRRCYDCYSSGLSQGDAFLIVWGCRGWMAVDLICHQSTETIESQTAICSHRSNISHMLPSYLNNIVNLHTFKLSLANTIWAPLCNINFNWVTLI